MLLILATEKTEYIDKIESIAKSDNIQVIYLARDSDYEKIFTTYKAIKFTIIHLDQNSIQSSWYRQTIRELLIRKINYLIVSSSDFALNSDAQSIPFHLRGKSFLDTNLPNFENVLRLNILGHDIKNYLSDLPDFNLATETIKVYQSSIFDIHILERAWLKVRQYARQDTTYYDEFMYEMFDRNFSANLLIIEELLSKENFHLEPLFTVAIPKQAQIDTDLQAEPIKTRDLYFPEPHTAIVLQAICDVIAPILEPLLDLEATSQDQPLKVAYANRVIINQQDTIDIFEHWRVCHSDFRHDIKQFARENRSGIWFRTDIKRYYPNIIPDILISMLRQYVDNSYIIDLIEEYLNLEAINSNGAKINIQGLPAGIPLSNLLGNFYLHKVDQEISQKALRYFRYVDDIVLFASSALQMVQIKQDLYSSLKKIGLTIYLEDSPKVDEGDAFEIERLDSAIETLSPLLGVNYQNYPDGEYKEKVRDTLYDVLITVERFDQDSDEEVYAKYAALAVHKLHELDYPEDELIKIVYRFLRDAPLRSRAIRSLIEYLIQRIVDSPTLFNRLKLELTSPSAPSYLLIAFLQAIRTYNSMPPNILDFVKELAFNVNYMVAGEAVYSLIKLNYSDGLDTLLIRLQSVTELIPQSEYFVARAFWYLISFGETNEILRNITLRILSTKLGHYAQNSVIYALSMNSKYQWTRDLFYSLNNNLRISINEYTIVSILAWARKLLLYEEIENDSFWDILLPLIRLFSPTTQEKLMGNMFGEFIEIGELEKINSSTISANHARLLLEFRGLSDTGEIYYFASVKKLAYENTLSHYGHNYISVPVDIDGKVGILEIFGTELLIRSNFKTFEMWTEYLIFLEEMRVIQVVDVRDLNNGNIATIYEAPSNYEMLSDKFQNNDLSDSAKNAIQLLQQINKLVGYTKGFRDNQDFQYLTVNSQYIFVESSLKVLLACIGSSLDGIPRYFVSPSHTNTQEASVVFGDVGIKAYSLFLGYLFIELLINEDPVELNKRIKGLVERTYLSEADEFSNFPSHIRGFLTRASNSNPEYRYHDTHSIDIDISHILSFYQYIDDSFNLLSDDELMLFEFVDYMILRLQTHKRNPELAGLLSEQRIDYLIKYISEDLYRFAPKNSDQYNWLLSKLNDVKPLSTFDNNTWQWLSIPSKQLMLATLFWNICVEEYLQLPDTKETFVLNIPNVIFLAEAVKYERMACVQTSARANTSLEDLSEIKKLTSNDYRKIAKRIPPPVYSQEVNMSDGETEKLIHTYERLYNQEEREHFELDSYLIECHPTAYLSLLTNHSLVILDKNDSVIWQSRNLSTNAELFISSTILYIAFHRESIKILPSLGVDGSFKKDAYGKPIAFYSAISELPDYIRSENFSQDFLIKRFVEVIHYLMQLSNSTRGLATVVEYDVQRHGISTGSLRQSWNKPIQPFNDQDLIKLPKVKGIAFTLPDDTQVTIDTFQANGQTNIGSLLATPLNLFALFQSKLTETTQNEVNDMRNQIFISYAHSDENGKESIWLNRTLTQLKPLERIGAITKAWSDLDISAGSRWEQSIKEAINSAKVVILLITPKFFESDFIVNEELQPIYDAHKKGLLEIIAIACSSTNYKLYDPYLHSIQWGNKPDNPLDLMSLPEQNREWISIVETIINAYKK